MTEEIEYKIENKIKSEKQESSVILHQASNQKPKNV